MSAHQPPRPPSDPDANGDDFEDDETVTMRVTQVRLSQPEPKAKDRATITVISGPDTGRVHSLGEVATIGRAKDCDIALGDSSVSRLHAQIVRSPDGARWLTDLKSRNGTFVDGFRVARHQLRDGDRIQLGPAVQLRYAITDDEEERLLHELYESSVRDPLTGIFNRKHFGDRLASELSFAVRHRTEVALLLFDIDHFKRVNDTWGHLAGDQVLRTVAGLVARTVRAEDIFARYGGEEFAVIARGIGASGANALAERIRSVVRAATVQFEGTVIRVTVSVGVATSRCCEGRVSREALIGVADRRLYDAKDKGRDRVVGPQD